MKTKNISILFALSSAFLLGACGEFASSSDASSNVSSLSSEESISSSSDVSSSPSGESISSSSDASSSTSEESSTSSIDWGFDDSTDVSEGTEQDFAISSDVEDGYTYEKETNTYTIVSAGTFACTGKLIEGRLVVNAPDLKVVIELSNATITNSKDSPIHLLDADSVDISAKSGTENKVYDLRTIDTKEEETVGSAAIYGQCDLTLKGKGKLEVVSNYNNGVHTKDDLEIKNLTLVSKAVDNALKGNDSVIIDAAKIAAISSGGDAIKTSSTDLSKNSVQRGSVTVLDKSVVNLYAAQDGIDAASDVIVSGGEVNVWTDKYSEYTGDATSTSKNLIYLRLPSSVYSRNYKYSACWNSSNGVTTWSNLDFYKSMSANTGGPGGGRPGGQSVYYYYAVERPSDARSVTFYAYNSTQQQGQSSSYVAKNTANTTIPTTGDTFVVTNIYGTTMVSGGWTSFASQSGNGGLDYSCKGIKADNEIQISGGKLNLTTRDDGLHANNENVLESTNAKGKGNVVISGGEISIASDDDAIKADQDLTIIGGKVNVSKSYEAFEGNRVLIEGGESKIYASDDAVNAVATGSYSPLIQISGGRLDATCPAGDTDTIDSNGKFVMTGGVAILRNGSNGGQSNTGGCIDTDGGTTVTGGTLVCCGQLDGIPTGSKYSTSTSLSSGSYTITDGSSTEIVGWDLTQTYKAYLFWSDQFVTGQTYNVNRDGSKVLSFTK